MLVLLLIPLSVYGQHSRIRLKEAKEIYWCGLDFPLSKMIGSAGFRNESVVADRYIYNDWNDILFTEPDKYKISKVLPNSKVIRNCNDLISDRNERVDKENIVQNSDHSIDFGDIRDAIKEYPAKDEEAIGLVFMVESFNKIKERSYVWVVFFDFKELNILAMSKCSGKPRGMGVQNYWINSIKRVIRDASQDMRWGEFEYYNHNWE